MSPGDYPSTFGCIFTQLTSPSHESGCKVLLRFKSDCELSGKPLYFFKESVSLLENEVIRLV